MFLVKNASESPKMALNAKFIVFKNLKYKEKIDWKMDENQIFDGGQTIDNDRIIKINIEE